MRIYKLLLSIALVSLFLFSSSSTLAHPGHDHPEEAPVASQTSEVENVQPTTTALAEATHNTPLWIPVAAIVGGIVVGVIGIALLHTRVLHPKNKE